MKPRKKPRKPFGTVTQSEHDIQSKCVAHVRTYYPDVLIAASLNGVSLGDPKKNPAIWGYINKLKAGGMLTGDPDLRLTWRDREGFPRLLFIEMKAPGKTPEPHQEALHDVLMRQGFPVTWTDSFEGFIGILEKWDVPRFRGVA